MFYSDSTTSIKEQLKDVKISIPKVLLILLADIMIATFAVFMGIIGAKTIGCILVAFICTATLLIPIGKQKNEPIVWTIHKNDTNE